MKYLFHERLAYCRFRKYYQIMRLTAILLIIVCLHAGAKGFTQTVSLSMSNIPLDKVCKEIEKQTGYYFVYAKNLNEKKLLISLDIKSATINEALDRIFVGLPFTYKLINKVVVVNTVNTSRFENATTLDLGPAVEIKGRITNSHGEPLANASIFCKKTGRGTETNANGEFKLKGLSSEDEITISYTGYRPAKIKIGNRTNFTLVLDETSDELDKAVVQAYGTTSRRFATGNISTVTAEEISKQPVVNPLMALQGRVAGLEITPNAGYNSGMIKVEIRGRNPINSSITSDPLYIIDGVPLTILEIGGLSNNNTGSTGFIQNSMAIPGAGQSPFFNLNPNDIESVEVLKDADATAIYGSRAANGVILITTKKGKAGKTQLALTASQGVSEVTRHWSMLNTQQYLQMRREAFKNDAIVPTAGNAPDLLTWDTTRYTDWQKFLWGKMGKWTDVQAGLSGGNAQTIFRIGVGYNRSTDISTVSGVNQRASLSFNLNHRTLDQRLSVSFTNNYSFSEVNIIGIPGAATLPPNAPAPFNNNGKLNYSQWDALGIGGSFPFAGLLNPYDSKTSFLASNLSFNYIILKGLSARLSLGYNNGQANQTYFFPIAAQDPAITNATGMAEFGNNRNSNWIIEPQLEYNGLISKGRINILLGGSVQSTTTEGLSVQGTGYTNDELLGTISNAPVKNANDNYGQYRYAAIFGRINYNLESKYIVSLNARRDGSSRFGPGRQFGNFGSIGLAWIFTEENWLKEHIPSVISFGKFRTSYGTTGSDAVGDYAYITQWNANGLANYDGISPLIPLLNANPNYRWSVNKKMEGALDLGFMKDRINLEISYYRNRCGNQLIQFPTAIFTGFGNVTANLPAEVQNSGWEFLINAQIIDHKVFSWSLNLNTAINNNKLLAYPNLEKSPYANIYKIGQPLNQSYVLHYTGVDPQTGQYSFLDRNHDGLITINYSVPPGTSNDDRYRVNLVPKFMGGIVNNFKYKNFGLSVSIYFKKQIGINSIYTGNYPGTRFNQPMEVLNRWMQSGDIKSISRFTTAPGVSSANFNLSDGRYTDASFIRLSNLSLSYNLPNRIAKKAGMMDFKVFLNGQNLFVITRYKGLDPETQNFGSMPISKIFTAGLSFGF